MTTPAWVDELDLHVGPPIASMGTRSLDEDRWLRVDDEWIGQRNEARALLRNRRDDVLVPVTTDLAADAACELGARIDAWLDAHHPGLVDDAHLDETDPMAAAACRVAEDLCLITPSEKGWVLDSSCVCFPSYWRLQDKIGRSLSEVHAPVPGYSGALAARVDAFLSRLHPGQGVWRRNWSIHDDPAMFLPEHRDVRQSGDRWLRSEYQTLVRLPRSAAIVFTIRTQQVPLDALVDRPDRRAALAAAVRGWSPAQRAYKGSAADEAVLHRLEDAPR